jgi:hypothetical protein
MTGFSPPRRRERGEDRTLSQNIVILSEAKDLLFRSARKQQVLASLRMTSSDYPSSDYQGRVKKWRTHRISVWQ